MVTNIDLERWAQDALRVSAQKRAIDRTIYFATLLNKAISLQELADRQLVQWHSRYDQLCADIEAYKRASDSDWS